MAYNKHIVKLKYKGNIQISVWVSDNGISYGCFNLTDNTVKFNCLDYLLGFGKIENYQITPGREQEVKELAERLYKRKKYGTNHY